MGLQVEIIKTIKENGGVPPFTVWTADFVDLRLNGEEVPNSGSRSQHDTAKSELDAALMYIDVNRPSEDVRVKQPARIVDSRNIQVYP